MRIVRTLHAALLPRRRRDASPRLRRAGRLDALRLSFLGAALASSVGCTVELSETVHGSGVSATEFREVDAFEAIEVHGGLDVQVVVGQQAHVMLSGDDNLIEYVQTELEDGRLHLRVRRGFRLEPAPRIEVGAPELFAVTLIGGGNVEVKGVDASTLALDLSGSGDVTCVGSVETLAVDVTGSGNMHLRHLVAAQVEAGITGSGDIETHATQVLTASITGSGDLIYRGKPRIVSRVTGSGEIRSERE